MEGSPEQDWPAIHRHKSMKTTQPRAGFFYVRMLGDQETKARDPETTPEKHEQEKRQQNHGGLWPSHDPRENRWD